MSAQYICIKKTRNLRSRKFAYIDFFGLACISLVISKENLGLKTGRIDLDLFAIN